MPKKGTHLEGGHHKRDLDLTLLGITPLPARWFCKVLKDLCDQVLHLILIAIDDDYPLTNTVTVSFSNLDTSTTVPADRRYGSTPSANNAPCKLIRHFQNQHALVSFFLVPTLRASVSIIASPAHVMSPFWWWRRAASHHLTWVMRAPSHWRTAPTSWVVPASSNWHASVSIGPHWHPHRMSVHILMTPVGSTCIGVTTISPRTAVIVHTVAGWAVVAAAWGAIVLSSWLTLIVALPLSSIVLTTPAVIPRVVPRCVLLIHAGDDLHQRPLQLLART
mmetsp:Transcript_75594/g.175271  ORF Transcript_75594/g.175271 Transcript_75594/m.175271 type:complete len:277 (-) Transcript_75594:496-1326(-)